MESRVKAYEQRLEKSIKEQEGLLDDVEQIRNLKLSPLKHFKDRLVEARDLSLRYADADEPVFTGLSFEIRNGERVFLEGRNGCGKSSLIKAILASARTADAGNMILEGTLQTASHLKISYISQDTSHLHGDLKTHAMENGLDYSLFLAVLWILALEQTQFNKKIEDFSEGQKKKVLIATSLLTPAHLYIWDEPLNYVDVFSRMQLEKLIREYSPTMLIVEHDVRFAEEMATKTVRIFKEE